MSSLTGIKHPTEWKPHEVERFIFTTPWRIPPPDYVIDNSVDGNPILGIAGCNLAMYGFTMSSNLLPGAPAGTNLSIGCPGGPPAFYCERNGYMIGGLVYFTKMDKRLNLPEDTIDVFKETKLSQLRASIVSYVMESFRWHCARYPRHYGPHSDSHWRVRCMKETWNEWWIPVHGVQFFEGGEG